MAEADLFSLEQRVAVVTGGAGILGFEHSLALASKGCRVAMADLNVSRAKDQASKLNETLGAEMVFPFELDVTSSESIEILLKDLLRSLGRIDILINNAAIDPKVEDNGLSSRLEHFPEEEWQRQIDVGLTGAFLCSKRLGAHMARQMRGVILNIASDLSVIAPDQRLYAKPEIAPERQVVKPVSYSVIKTALIGLTRYLASYWAAQGVRVNALSPAGVGDRVDDDFRRRICNLIPMGRMATRSDYHGTIQYLCSDASAYMTGQNIVVDGGRSII